MAGPLEGIITHKFVQANGIKMHYVEAGSGPTILLVHGFPDCWYGWRRQIPALVAEGFHVVAPDLRGFGHTDAPDSVAEYTALHVVGDLIGLLDALQVKQVVVVGHDWGCSYAADLVIFRPDRVIGLAVLGAASFPRHGDSDNLSNLCHLLGNDFYISVFKKPGVAEAIFSKARNEDIISAFFLRWNEDKEHLSLPRVIEDEPLPDWLTKEDLRVYAEAFSNSGWTGGLNHYRCFRRSWELKAPWKDVLLPAHVPVLLLIAKQDIISIMAGVKDAESERNYVMACQQIIPNLKAFAHIDATHFMHQEKAEEVNKTLINFLQQYKEQ